MHFVGAIHSSKTLYSGIIFKNIIAISTNTIKSFIN